MITEILVLTIILIGLFLFLKGDKTETHPSTAGKVTRKWANKTEPGDPLKMRNAYIISQTLPTRKLGKIQKIFPQAQNIKWKDQTAKFDILVIKQQTGSTLFGLIKKHKTITLALSRDEHSPLMPDDDLYIYTEGIAHFSNGLYRTTNHAPETIMISTFEDGVMETYLDILDNLGAIAQNMLESNLPHVKNMERSGGVLKIAKRGVETAGGTIKKGLKVLRPPKE